VKCVVSLHTQKKDIERKRYRPKVEETINYKQHPIQLECALKMNKPSRGKDFSVRIGRLITVSVIFFLAIWAPKAGATAPLQGDLQR